MRTQFLNTVLSQYSSQIWQESLSPSVYNVHPFFFFPKLTDPDAYFIFFFIFFYVGLNNDGIPFLPPSLPPSPASLAPELGYKKLIVPDQSI